MAISAVSRSYDLDLFVQEKHERQSQLLKTSEVGKRTLQDVLRRDRLKDSFKNFVAKKIIESARAIHEEGKHLGEIHPRCIVLTYQEELEESKEMELTSTVIDFQQLIAGPDTPLKKPKERPVPIVTLCRVKPGTREWFEYSYLAPEIVEANLGKNERDAPILTQETDLFMLGCSLYRLYYGEGSIWMDGYLGDKREVITEADWNAVWEKCSAEGPLINGLIYGLLQKDPKKRISAERALEIFNEYCAN